MTNDPSQETDGGPEENSEAVRRSLLKREIKFQHSSRFVPILQHAQISLLVSTYAAGKVAAIGTGEEGLRLGFSNFQQAMGMALGPPGLAIGGPNLIWFLRHAGNLAPDIEPKGRFDHGFLTRESFVTGNIQIHEMAWGSEGELWIVNTLFSCLCTLHEDFNFVPQWQPDFITELAPQDRCHLNGVLMQDGKPKYVTALGVSDSPRGWREDKANGGVLIDIESGQIVASDFCMPHSPRMHQGKIYVLDSGRGRLVTVDPNSGHVETITDYPGYGRGMSLHGQFAFIGMSKARETSVFGGVPICEDRSKMRCGIVVVDLLIGKAIAFLEFETGVEELFDVKVIPNTRSPVLCGPFPNEDQQVPVWVVPKPSRADELLPRTGEKIAVSR